ncbi:MAG: hypothetical protein JSR91_08855 [Proteobacteria bacterium]|nr:hypothetical protein [Pseudomonadota bacterium]
MAQNLFSTNPFSTACQAFNGLPADDEVPPKARDRIRSRHKDLELRADAVVDGYGVHTRDIALRLLRSDIHQARCAGTFLSGRLSAGDPDALSRLKLCASSDEDWLTQESSARAFDRFCADTGHQSALPTLRE